MCNTADVHTVKKTLIYYAVLCDQYFFSLCSIVSSNFLSETFNLASTTLNFNIHLKYLYIWTLTVIHVCKIDQCWCSGTYLGEVSSKHE